MPHDVRRRPGARARRLRVAAAGARGRARPPSWRAGGARRPAIRNLLVATTLALAGVGAWASAASPVDPFQAVSAMQCVQLEQDLATLQAIQGAYSLHLKGRAQQYRALQDEVAALHPVQVPYYGQDLSPVPLEQATGIRDPYKQVPHQVAFPQWGMGALSLTLAGISGAAGALNYANTPYGQSPDWASIVGYGLGAAVGVGLTIYYMTMTRTVYVKTYQPSIASANSQIQARVDQQNQQIEQENATRAQHRQERQAAVAKNQRIAAQRSALVAKLNTYEETSTTLARNRIQALDAATSKRCLDRLVYEGSAVRIGTPTARVYLIVRPLNSAGNVLAKATTLPGLSFGVRSLTLMDAGVTIARDGSPTVAAVVPASAAPTAVTYPPSFVAVEVNVSLLRAVPNPPALSVDASVTATQDGKQFQAHAHGKAVLVP